MTKVKNILINRGKFRIMEIIGSKMEILRHPLQAAIVTTVQFHIKLLITLVLLIVGTTHIILMVLLHFHGINCQTLALQIIIPTAIIICIISIPLMMMMHTYIKT